MKYNIITNSQNIFCIYIYVAAGAIYETAKQSGMSHLLEHLLLKRTKHYTSNVLIDKMTELGGVNNATTDKDATTYYIYTNASNWEKAITILASVLLNPSIDDHELKLEKEVVVQELNMRTDYNSDFYNMSILSILDPENIYTKKVEGTVSNVRSFEKSKILKYFHSRYTDFNMTINIPAHLKPQVLRLLKQKFGKETPTDFYIKKELQLSNAYTKKYFVAYKEKNQFTHIFTWPAFPKLEFKSVVILNFIRYAFINGSFKSVLMYLLRTKLGLVYSLDTSNTAYRYLGMFSIEVSSTKNNIEQIMKILLEQLERLKFDGIENIEFFKKAYLNTKKLVFAEEHFRTSWYAENFFYGVNIDVKQYVKYIKDITNADIKEVAATIFDRHAMGIVSFGKYKDSKQVLAKIKILSE